MGFAVYGSGGLADSFGFVRIPDFRSSGSTAILGSIGGGCSLFSLALGLREGRCLQCCARGNSGGSLYVCQKDRRRGLLRGWGIWFTIILGILLFAAGKVDSALRVLRVGYPVLECGRYRRFSYTFNVEGYVRGL